MKLGFISDVHSNIHALNCVLEYGRKLAVDEWCCCGDIVGYNAFPGDCVSLIRENHILSVLGNHDWAVVTGDTSGFNPYGVSGVEYARKILTDEDKDFLKNYPQKMVIQRDGVSFFFVHGSPRDPLFEYVNPYVSDVLLQVFAEMVPAEIIILGHTHVPMERYLTDSVFLNPGSVGQPRDGNPDASFLVFDTEKKEGKHYRVSYDIQAAADAIRKNGLPEFLAQRLFDGR